MHIYWIEYGHRNIDDGYVTVVGIATVRAETVDDAIEKFFEDDDDYGFTVIRIARAHEKGVRWAKWRKLA